MGQNNYDDQWQTWHEGPPGRDNRWLLILGIGLAVVVLVALCAAGYWFVVRPMLAEPTAVAAPPIPTVPGGEQTATTGALSPTAPPESEVTDESGATPTTAASATPEPPTPTPQPDFAVAGMGQPPIIDGLLEEWGGGPTIVSAYRVHAAQGWDGSADLEATWQLGWDANNLYVGVTVVDDVHVQTQTGNVMYRGDSLEIQVDTNPAANATNVNPNTFQILLSPGNFEELPPSAFRFQGTSGGRILDATGHGIQVDASQTENGYMLEAAIPWRDLNVSAAEGVMLGIALNANDNDRPGEAVQEVMMSSSPNRTLTNPQSWGLMVLE
ncbi:MAG: sugar-binding protein [Anaerolineae bacterium]|nr:sugar-binding protein [Anaerolineae bacterium]